MILLVRANGGFLIHAVEGHSTVDRGYISKPALCGHQPKGSRGYWLRVLRPSTPRVCEKCRARLADTGRQIVAGETQMQVIPLQENTLP